MKKSLFVLLAVWASFALCLPEVLTPAKVFLERIKSKVSETYTGLKQNEGIKAALGKYKDSVSSFAYKAGMYTKRTFEEFKNERVIPAIEKIKSKREEMRKRKEEITQEEEEKSKKDGRDQEKIDQFTEKEEQETEKYVKEIKEFLQKYLEQLGKTTADEVEEERRRSANSKSSQKENKENKENEEKDRIEKEAVPKQDL